MNYRQALAFLKELETFGIIQGLERIESLLAELGNPHKELPELIQVVGTNGKGSVCAALESILKESFSTGLFTSPHLLDIRERFRVDGQMISPEALAQVITQVHQACQRLKSAGLEPPTEFEVETALALSWFCQERVEIAILEAGLGGGLDSTHAAHGKKVVITNIGLDHQKYLGEDIPAIARSKAEIIEEGAVVVCGETGLGLETISLAARAKNALLLVLGRDIQYGLEQDLGLRGQTFHVRTRDNYYQGLHTPLLGRHQLANGALAVAMGELCGASGEDIRTGLAKVSWPGRLEFLDCQTPVLLDGAHNPPGMAALSSALAIYAQDKRITAVIGMLDDKLAQAALPYLFPHLDKLIISRPPLEERSLNWQSLVQICAAQGLPVQVEEDLCRACALAEKNLPEDGLILVCGSLSLLAPARKYFCGANPLKEAAYE